MSLTGSMGLRLGPLMFFTAVNHFLERHKDSATRSKARDEILFDEGELVWSIARTTQAYAVGVLAPEPWSSHRGPPLLEF